MTHQPPSPAGPACGFPNCTDPHEGSLWGGKYDQHFGQVSAGPEPPSQEAVRAAAERIIAAYRQRYKTLGMSVIAADPDDVLLVAFTLLSEQARIERLTAALDEIDSLTSSGTCAITGAGKARYFAAISTWPMPPSPPTRQPWRNESE